MPATPPDSSSIAGLLLSGLAPHEVAVFDLFEGEEYEKRRVFVSLGGDNDGDGGAADDKTGADVYLWTRPHLAADLLPSPPDWDYRAFRSTHLERYTKMATAFGEEARAAVADGGEWGGGGAAARAAELASDDPAAA